MELLDLQINSVIHYANKIKAKNKQKDEETTSYIDELVAELTNGEG